MLKRSKNESDVEIIDVDAIPADDELDLDEGNTSVPDSQSTSSAAVAILPIKVNNKNQTKDNSSGFGRDKGRRVNGKSGTRVEDNEPVGGFSAENRTKEKTYKYRIDIEPVLNLAKALMQVLGTPLFIGMTALCLAVPWVVCSSISLLIYSGVLTRLVVLCGESLALWVLLYQAGKYLNRAKQFYIVAPFIDDFIERNNWIQVAFTYPKKVLGTFCALYIAFGTFLPTKCQLANWILMLSGMFYSGLLGCISDDLDAEAPIEESDDTLDEDALGFDESFIGNTDESDDSEGDL